jgi:hypothetical protein
MKIINITGFLLFLPFLFSCIKNDKNREAVQTILKEWSGKEIKFPDNVQAVVINCDSVNYNPFESEYKILFYSDSSGCTNCDLQLSEWHPLISEANLLIGENISFLFYIHPKNKQDLDHILHINSFDYPVFYDMDNSIDRINQFPKQREYQCFLLDKNNRILLIGNPALNDKIWNLMKQKILNTDNKANNITTTVQIDKEKWNLGSIQQNNNYKVNFILKNTGNNELIIRKILT